MKLSSKILFCLAATGWAMMAGSGGGWAGEVDVEIVLAVDASGSVNKSELQMQLDGIAAAFRNKDVLNAITSGRNHKVAAALLIWSDAAYRKVPTKWHIIGSRRAAESFAKIVQGFRQHLGGIFSVIGGGTGIGDGLAYALKMIERNGSAAPRRIVDISGDGIETKPWSKGAVRLPEARAAAALRHVTVNGLAILTDVPDLDDWYRANVIVGAASFVIKARDFRDYGRAIRMKLLRELTTSVARFARPRSTVHAQEQIVLGACVSRHSFARHPRPIGMSRLTTWRQKAIKKPVCCADWQSRSIAGGKQQRHVCDMANIRASQRLTQQ